MEITRKSHTDFRLVPKSVTVSDLERRNGRYFALFHFSLNSIALGPITSKWLKIDRLSRMCSPPPKKKISSFLQIWIYSNICRSYWERLLSSLELSSHYQNKLRANVRKQISYAITSVLVSLQSVILVEKPYNRPSCTNPTQSETMSV